MMIREAISMRLRKTTCSLFAWSCFLTFGVAAAQAQQFSADIVTRHDDVSAPAGRLSVLDDKVRIETTELPDGFFVVDAAKPSAYFVRPAAHIYMDARQSSRLTRLFVPVKLNAPCRQWQAMAAVARVAEQNEWRCERMREEIIDGRNTVAFRVLSGAGREYYAWIDRDRQFPLRIKTEDGTLIALEQIKDGPQPASSFEIPANARKFSPEALIERIKQSDVWVSAPNNTESSRR